MSRFERIKTNQNANNAILSYPCFYTFLELSAFASTSENRAWCVTTTLHVGANFVPVTTAILNIYTCDNVYARVQLIMTNTTQLWCDGTRNNNNINHNNNHKNNHKNNNHVRRLPALRTTLSIRQEGGDWIVYPVGLPPFGSVVVLLPQPVIPRPGIVQGTFPTR